MLVRFTKNTPSAPADTLVCERPDGSTLQGTMPRQGRSRPAPRTTPCALGVTARNVHSQKIARSSQPPRSSNASKPPSGAAPPTPRCSPKHSPPPAAAAESHHPTSAPRILPGSVSPSVNSAPPGARSTPANPWSAHFDVASAGRPLVGQPLDAHLPVVLFHTDHAPDRRRRRMPAAGGVFSKWRGRGPLLAAGASTRSLPTLAQRPAQRRSASPPGRRLPASLSDRRSSPPLFAFSVPLCGFRHVRRHP